MLNVIRIYTDNVRAYKRTSKTNNEPGLSPKLKTQLHNSYVQYQDLLENTLRDPGIPTELRQQINRNLRPHQLDLLLEMEDWGELYLLVQKLQTEAREERMAGAEGSVKDADTKENLAVNDDYETQVRDVFYRCHSMKPMWPNGSQPLGSVDRVGFDVVGASFS